VEDDRSFLALKHEEGADVSLLKLKSRPFALVLHFINTADRLGNRGKAFISYSIPSSSPYLVLYTTYPSSSSSAVLHLIRPPTIWPRQILYRYTYRVAKAKCVRHFSYTHFHDPEVKNASRAGNKPIVRTCWAKPFGRQKICQSATANARGINATEKTTSGGTTSRKQTKNV
jgi:hypothetical protein